jgi:hypothetical protein
MCLKFLSSGRNAVCRSLLDGDYLIRLFGRIAIVILLFFTFHSWFGVYKILKDEAPTTTQSSVLFQRRYLPIGGADLQFDQPWDVNITPVLTKFSELETGERFILR